MSTFEERWGIDRELLRQVVAARTRAEADRRRQEEDAELLRLGAEFRAEAEARHQRRENTT